MQGWPSLGENIVYLIWKNSIEQIAINNINLYMKNLIWVTFCKVLTKAIKFKDMGEQLASLLKEYYVVLQVTYIAHDPPTPNQLENMFHQEFSKYSN